jgi:ubiquitin-protein ligase
MPPEIYRLTYNIRGLYVSRDGEILERNVHLLEVNLSLGYPRRAPQCRMLTPVFHPNFDDAMVCIRDFWAASERLDDLVVRIGRMISYQEFNTKSPLNGLAAKWAAQNTNLLPIDTRNIAPPSESEHTRPLPPATAETAATEAAAADNPREVPWSQKYRLLDRQTHTRSSLRRDAGGSMTSSCTSIRRIEPAHVRGNLTSHREHRAPECPETPLAPGP